MEARIRAQMKIDEVYFSYMLGSHKTLSQAVSETNARRKVESYLKQSVALEQYWGTPVTEPMLQAELRRITRNSKFPDRLDRVFAALGHDPNLVMECFVRPVLVDRLSRSFFASDVRIHGTSRQEAEKIREALLSGQLDPTQDHPRRHLVGGELHESTPLYNSASLGPGPGLLSSEGIADEEASVITPDLNTVIEEPDRFVVVAPLEDRASPDLRAVYSVPKMSWDEWWRGVLETFDESRFVEPRYRGTGLEFETKQVVTSSTSPDCSLDDTWNNGSLAVRPQLLAYHVTVWTGNEMIVWGGYGFRYDPLTDTWAGVSSIGAPTAARFRQSAIWTGEEMIVWGRRQRQRLVQ